MLYVHFCIYSHLGGMRQLGLECVALHSFGIGLWHYGPSESLPSLVLAGSSNFGKHLTNI